MLNNDRKGLGEIIDKDRLNNIKGVLSETVGEIKQRIESSYASKDTGDLKDISRLVVDCYKNIRYDMSSVLDDIPSLGQIKNIQFSIDKYSPELEEQIKEVFGEEVDAKLLYDYFLDCYDIGIYSLTNMKMLMDEILFIYKRDFVSNERLVNGYLDTDRSTYGEFMGKPREIKVLGHRQDTSRYDGEYGGTYIKYKDTDFGYNDIVEYRMLHEYLPRHLGSEKIQSDKKFHDSRVLANKSGENILQEIQEQNLTDKESVVSYLLERGVIHDCYFKKSIKSGIVYEGVVDVYSAKLEGHGAIGDNVIEFLKENFPDICLIDKLSVEKSKKPYHEYNDIQFIIGSRERLNEWKKRGYNTTNLVHDGFSIVCHG